MAIVKYSNDINSVGFRGFAPKEIDAFFSLIYKLQDTGNLEITVDFEEIRRLSNYPRAKSKKEFVSIVENIYKKVLELHIRRSSENGKIIEMFNIFNYYRIDTEAETITVKVNEDMQDLLNDLVSGFTTFMLDDMTHMTTTYGKELFRLMKQFRTTGHMYMSIDEFRQRLSVPSTYSNGEMMRKVFSPSTVNQLQQRLPGFRYETKKSSKKGNSILGITLIWDKERALEDKFKQMEEMENIETIEREVSEWQQNPKLPDLSDLSGLTSFQ